MRGEQLSLSRKIKIFDKAYKLGEIMAEKYVNEYFTKISCSTNIYKAAECVDLWTVHQFAGDYNPIHTHASGVTGLSFIFWTKVPQNMRNISAGNLYSASGKENGCTTFIGNSSGDPYNFKPLNAKVYKPKVGHFLIFPNWLNHTVYPFMCEGERRTIGGNIALYKTSEERDKREHSINIFDNGNPLKWKISQYF